MKLRNTLIIPVLLVLAGCIGVKDFGLFWDSAAIDRSLAGKWDSARENGKDLAFSPLDDRTYNMKYESDPYPVLARTLPVGDATFLMTKKNEGDVGGNLIAYVVQGDVLVLFVPNRDKQKDFLARYPNIPFIITRTSMTIEELNIETMKWLQQIASEPEWWTEMQRFNRPKD